MQRILRKHNDFWSSTVKVICISLVYLTDSCYCTLFRRILNASDVNTCKQPLYYEVDTLYVIRAKNKIYSSECEINFLDWNDAIVGQPCVSLCVRVHNNSMKSCDFQMTYYDGLGDLNEKSFDCHSFPPILWCSRKNEIKIAFKELKKYRGDGYDITLEVTSYCSDEDDTSEGEPGNKRGPSYNEEKRREEKRTRDTVIIAGSLVSTVSFILVICWVTYCCWKRRNHSSDSAGRSQAAGSATSSSTPKSEASSHRPGQYTAYTATGTTSQPYPQPQSRLYLQQKPSNPYVNAYNYPQRQNSERYIQLPDSGIDMKDSFVQYKTNPQANARDVTFRDDRFLGVERSDTGHSYDADEDSPEKELTPPIPPRPNYQAKQYFI